MKEFVLGNSVWKTVQLKKTSKKEVNFSGLDI